MGQEEKGKIQGKIVKAARPSHFGMSRTRVSFNEAFNLAQKSPGTTYLTTGNATPFTVVAAVARKGDHKGERVLVFKTSGQERARAYPCCWEYATNCNRTYIDCYTGAL